MFGNKSTKKWIFYWSHDKLGGFKILSITFFFFKRTDAYYSPTVDNTQNRNLLKEQSALLYDFDDFMS